MWTNTKMFTIRTKVLIQEPWFTGHYSKSLYIDSILKVLRTYCMHVQRVLSNLPRIFKEPCNVCADVQKVRVKTYDLFWTDSYPTDARKVSLLKKTVQIFNYFVYSVNSKDLTFFEFFLVWISRPYFLASCQGFA